MEQKKKGTPLYMLCALAWFGFHCGSGTASGRQAWIRAAHFGSKGWWVCLIAWLLCALFMVIVMEYSRLIKAETYKDILKGGIYYFKNPTFVRIIQLIWDVMIFLAMMVASSACVAGVGELGVQLFGLPYWIGCAFFILIMLAAMLVGDKSLEIFGNVSIPLIILFFAIAGAGIIYAWPDFIATMTTDKGAPVSGNPTTLSLLSAGLTYACVQISFVQTAVVYAGKFESRSDSLKAGFFGFLFNFICLFLAFCACMAYYPEIGDSSMPILTIVQGFPGVLGMLTLIAYNIVLFLAYFTTAGSSCLGGIARYTPVLNKYIKNTNVCKAILIVIILLGSSLVATLGLDGVLDTAYGFLSNLRKPFWFFPIVILGTISLMKLYKANGSAQATDEAKSE